MFFILIVFLFSSALAKENQGQVELLAQSSSNRCRNAPWIDEAVVFQSVEAPQIEPLQQQYEDRQGLPYGEYDLVRRKPATLFVDIEGLRRKSAILQAFVNNTLYFAEDIRGNQKDYPIDLPMKERDLLDGVGSAGVKIRLIPDNNPSCSYQESFKVTVWETKKLDLRFAKINNKNCKPLREYPLYQVGGYRTYQNAYNVNNVWDLPHWPYESVSDKAVENFKFSDEVQDYLPDLLPLGRGDFRTYPDIIDLTGYCNNGPVRLYGPDLDKHSESIGILEDINELERQRIKKGGVENKIVAIIPMDYIPFHYANSFSLKEVEGASGSYGFVLHRREYSAHRKFLWWEWPSSKIGGSSNVLFIREDRHKHSTLSHELGHALGQRKEFYESKYKCRDFKYQKKEDCDQYEIRRSFKFGKIERRLLSIMHSGDNPINQKWIDRETFQKAFVHLLTEDNRRLAQRILNTPLSRDKALSKDKAITEDTIVIISGIYLKNGNLKKEKFLYDPRIEIHKEGGLITPSFEEGDVLIELKLDGKVIYANRLTSFTEIEFLREGGGTANTSYKLSSVPMTVSLPLKHGVTADYEVVIKQMANGSSERMLFSSKLPKR